MVKIAETVNSVATSTKQFVWCAGSRKEERDGSGNITKQFYSQGEIVSGANYYTTFDLLASVREMSDASGKVQSLLSYDPYGQVTRMQGTLLPDFQFGGYYYHVSSGLSLALYRAYSPNLGRWLSRDPIGEDGGTNLYAYVGNEPADATDPSGLLKECECIALALDILRAAQDALQYAQTKVDPTEDWVPHPSKWAQGGMTKPGGHTAILIQKLNTVKNLLDKFIRECKNKGMNPFTAKDWQQLLEDMRKAQDVVDKSLDTGKQQGKGLPPDVKINPWPTGFIPAIASTPEALEALRQGLQALKGIRWVPVP